MMKPRRACASPCATPTDKQASVIPALSSLSASLVRAEFHTQCAAPYLHAHGSTDDVDTAIPLLLRRFAGAGGMPRTNSQHPALGEEREYSYSSSSSPVNTALASNIGSVDAFIPRVRRKCLDSLRLFRDGSTLAGGSRFIATALLFSFLADASTRKAPKEVAPRAFTGQLPVYRTSRQQRCKPMSFACLACFPFFTLKEGISLRRENTVQYRYWSCIPVGSTALRLVKRKLF